ncbi:MAG: ribosome maturation factor RimM [Gammaproteobacteria bacterium]|nr:ribosome maturation factor RimM [Gammaproteobacteria bacterium]
MDPNRIVVVGRIGSAYGVKGWVHVHSFTDPISNLLDFKQLYRKSDDETWQQFESIEFHRHRDGLIARIDGCSDRTGAEALHNLELGVRRNALPSLQEDEFYWVDLIGLEVVNTEDIKLGKISNVIDTGASAVLDVRGENGTYLIPFAKPMLDSVSVIKRVTVRWNVDWRA